MFPVVNGVVDSKHVTTGPTMMVGHPAAIMSLSADGEKPGTGILWLNFASPNATDNSGAVFSTKHGRLAAYNAETMTELWNSEQVAARDSLGYFAKFNPPTVVNGKVYMAAFPAPEPYVHVCYCSEDRMQCRSTNCTPIRQAYHALNNMGYLVVYGANPPVNPPVRSFVADVLPAILGPLMDDPAFDIL
jgi:hypothetical protein